tara:strand:+ start:5030 stop:6427 length:1398 start_codon:yes stop_codon:yes gene_type:complete
MEKHAFDRVTMTENLLQKGYRFAQLEMPDLNGVPRGKITGIHKAFSPSGTGMSTLALCGRSADKLSHTPFSNVELGFPKMTARPDFDTLRPLPWTKDMVALQFDFYMNDGTPCPVDTRHLLKKVVKDYADLGISPLVALEFEVYVFHADAALEEQRWQDLKPFGRTTDFYYLTRFPSYFPLAKEFLGRMQDIGIEIEAFHTEYGRGMFEFMLAPMPPVEAADAAMRAKLYFKQLCAEHGLVASFMPVPSTSSDDTALGLHHNISLWRDGTNICWDDREQGLSITARHFAAGMIETMPDFHLLFRPWINSYRRMDPNAWSPTSASWALDNHTAAIRTVYGNDPAKLSRFEHRVPGTDTNPYLTIAAMLAGGLHGIRKGEEPPAFGSGDVTKDSRFVRLTEEMGSAIAQFQHSRTARDLFGDLFVDHFTITRQDEWDDFRSWCDENQISSAHSEVTSWEYEHYFEWV